MSKTGGSKESHVALLRAVAERRDRDCFTALFDYYVPRIITWVSSTPDGESIAEEVAQEAMLAVWHKARLFDFSKGSVASWIFTIARNQRVDKLRRQAASSPLLDYHQERQTNIPTPEDMAIDDERDQRLAQAVRELPPEQAKVVHEVFFEGKVHTEVSRDLGIPLGTVKSRLRLALVHLQAAMLYWLDWFGP